MSKLRKAKRLKDETIPMFARRLGYPHSFGEIGFTINPYGSGPPRSERDVRAAPLPNQREIRVYLISSAETRKGEGRASTSGMTRKATGGWRAGEIR